MRLRFIVVCVVFIWISFLQAAPILSIIQSDKVYFPPEFHTHRQAISDFDIKNRSSTPRTVYVVGLPAPFGILQHVNNACPEGDSFLLQGGQSCVLRLGYISKHSASVNEHLPSVCLTPTYGSGCMRPTKAVDFSVLDGALTQHANLETEDHLFVLPDSQESLIIKNIGNTLANNVTLKIPPDLMREISVDNAEDCSVIAPEASCTLKLSISKDAVFEPGTSALMLSASNAETQSITLGEGRLKLNSLLFTKPGNQEMVFENLTTKPLANIETSSTGNILDVTLLSNTCHGTLEPHASCHLEWAAGSEASGSQQVVFNFFQGEADIEKTASVSVSQPKIVVNPNASDQGQTIIAEDSGYFVIKNMSEFSARSIEVSADPNDTWLQMVSHCPSDLVAGASCQVDYAILGLHDLSSYVQVSNDHGVLAQQNLEPAYHLSMGIDADRVYFDRAEIKVSNLTSEAQKLESISFQLPGNVEVCDQAGSNCGGAVFASTCQKDSTVAAGSTCVIWLHLKEADHLYSNKNAVGNVSLNFSAGESGTKTLSRNFDFVLGQSLYVVGGFSKTAHDEPMRYVANWDGENWHAVKGGTNSLIRVIKFINGELVFGGDFSSPLGVLGDSPVASWNGERWMSLGFGLDGQVFSLQQVGNVLYAGGLMARQGASNADMLVCLKEGHWQSAYSEVAPKFPYVLSMTLLSNRLYLAGIFSNINGVSMPNSAYLVLDNDKWYATDDVDSPFITYGSYQKDGVYYLTGMYPQGFLVKSYQSETGWKTLGNAFDGLPYTFGFAGKKLIVAGQFTMPDGKQALAEWDGSAWHTLAGGVKKGTGIAYIDSILSVGSQLYVSGGFDSVGDIQTPANNIAMWDGQNWHTLNSGLNGRVYSMAIVPQMRIN